MNVSWIGKPTLLHAPPDTETGEMDIEISDSSAPNFTDLFEDEPIGETGLTTGDLKIRSFNRVEKLVEEPKPYFKDQEYYKKLLAGEGESAKRVHQILQEYIKAEDPADKSHHRMRLIPAFWDLAGSVAGKVGAKLPDPKMLFLRYGILLPTAIDAEQRQVISTLIYKNTSGEPIFYVDEWLREVAFGRVNSSSVDETKAGPKNEAAKFGQLLDKTKGRYDAQISLISSITQEMATSERMILDHANNISQHNLLTEYGGLPAPYNESQKSAFTDMGEQMRRLSANNKRLQTAYQELGDLRSQLDNLKTQEGDQPEETQIDVKVVSEEMNTLKQMAKMCVGRQGNHFPMLSKQYFRASLRDLGIRENIINMLADIEYLDPGLFLRTFKQQTNRIVPNVILLPCYGDLGVCWEPFERHNRATSRGRLAIPMFPKELRFAVIAACADLRWQVAKEKAAHYWMEEGLTGWYYQWFAEQKLKGDVKDKFVEDYTLWIMKESEATQKLEREVRDIFWRYMPFPQDVKDKLKSRGFVYAELAKKDQNRAMSDGY